MAWIPKLSKTIKTRISPIIPSEHRSGFELLVCKENAHRLIWAFVVGGITHLLNFWIGWQRMQAGLFEQVPAYRWIFYNQMVWWLIAWLPIELIRNWARIRAGQYPLRRLKLLCNIGILWGWSFTLTNGLFHFEVNQGLGYYSTAMIVICLFILPEKSRFWLLLLSVLMMIAAIYLVKDLTLLQKRFWATSVFAVSLVVFFLSTVWYNNIARQFLTEKMLESQKHRIAEQADLLSEKNRIIEEDKAQLTAHLETANSQLNNFALRFAQKRKFLEQLKSELAAIATLNGEDAHKRKSLLGRIDQEMESENDWEQFKEQFERVNPRFFSSVLAQFPMLNSNELRLMALLKMNLGTQEIANILHITPQSLNTARYRLRKRLGLDPADDLHLFIHRFC